MGSFLEKNYDWEKEADRMRKFLDRLEQRLLVRVGNAECAEEGKLLRHIRHFKKVFSED